MAEIKSFPNNQDEFIGAQYEMKFLHGRTSGVFGADKNAAVFAVSEQIAVEVTDGIGWISNAEADGVVWWNDSFKETGDTLKLKLDIADGVLDRIDRVVVSWETTNYVANPQIEILKGVPSSKPVPPELTNNNILRQISLARIEIKAGTVALSQSMITDERLDPTVCGIVNERIEVDTSMIYAQLEEFKRISMDEFNQWFENVKNTLGNDAAGNLLILINELTARVNIIDSIIENYIIYNRFIVLFDNLNGIETNGIWNEQRQRIEC